jgi:hypothetical protein
MAIIFDVDDPQNLAYLIQSARLMDSITLAIAADPLIPQLLRLKESLDSSRILMTQV